MAEKITAYGRVNGKVKFQYGPQTFNADWGGVFTALEIANMLTKIPKVNLGKSKVPIRKLGKKVESLNLRLWLERLEMSLIGLNLHSLMISGTIKKWYWVDEVLPSQIIMFTGQRPSQLITHALVKMGLNKWGVVMQLTLALSEFSSKATSGQHSVSVFIDL